MNRIFVISLLSLALPFGLFAQMPPNTVVESPLEVHPENTEKVTNLPITPTEKADDLEYSHDSLPALAQLDPGDPQIRVRGLPTPKNAEVDPRSFYLRAGFGTPMSPLAEISYHLSANERVEFGLSYRHHSAQSSSNELMRFSRHAAGIQGTYFLEQGIGVGGSLSYDWYGLRFYGTDTLNNIDTLGGPYPADRLKQRFSRFRGNARMFNSKANAIGLNYSLDFNLYTLGDFFSSNELGIEVLAKVDKRFGERFAARIDMGLESVHFTDTADQKLLVPFVQPGVFFHLGGFRAKLGAWIGSDAGTFFAAPDVELSYDFFDGGFALFAGWTGGVRINSFDRLTQYNPFLNSVVELRGSRWQERFGGVRGSTNGLTYEARFAQRPMNVLPMFINDGRADYGRFEVLYDTMSLLTISGNVSYTKIKNFSASLQGAYHIYNETNFGLPNLDANLILRYSAFKKKLLLRGEFYTVSGINYVDATGETGVIKPLLDLNFGMEFKVTKNIGLFANLNNLLNNKRERWYRYPQFGFNVMGGVTVKF
jgi:hypothetical protein